MFLHSDLITTNYWLVNISIYFINPSLSQSIVQVTISLKRTPLSIPLACRLAANYLLHCVLTQVRVATLAREFSL